MKHTLLPILVALGAISLINSAEAKRDKRPRAGELDKLVFTDTAHGYAVSFPDQWSIKVRDAEENVRVVAQKKEYDIPQKFRDAPNYTTIPKIKLYVDTTTLDIRSFIDSLKSQSFDSKQKRSIVAELDLLDGEFLRPAIETYNGQGGLSGKRLSTKRKYFIDLQTPGQMTSENYQEFKQGDITFFKKDSSIIMVYFICERMYYENLVDSYNNLLKSFHFLGATPATGGS